MLKYIQYVYLPFKAIPGYFKIFVSLTQVQKNSHASEVTNLRLVSQSQISISCFKYSHHDFDKKIEVFKQFSVHELIIQNMY